MQDTKGVKLQKSKHYITLSKPAKAKCQQFFLPAKMSHLRSIG